MVERDISFHYGDGLLWMQVKISQKLDYIAIIHLFIFAHFRTEQGVSIIACCKSIEKNFTVNNFLIPIFIIKSLH